MNGSSLRVLATGLLLTVASGGLSAQRGTRSTLDSAGMDRHVRPGDDFFRFANGGWLQSTPIPADRSSYNNFVVLTEEANRRTADLIQQAGKATTPPSAEVAKIGEFYAAFMDEKTIEAKGISPLAPSLGRIRAIDDKRALASFLGGEMRADVDPLNNTELHTSRLFGLWVSPDLDDPARNAAYLLQGGLGLPDRENYLSHDPKDEALQAKYRAHIAAVLKLASVSDATARAQRVYDLESKIAATHATRTESAAVHNAKRWARTALATNAPGLDWDAYFTAAGLTKQTSMIVWHPGAFTGIAALAGSESLDSWKDYLTFHAIDRASPLLSAAFADENFRFYGTALTGAPQQRERWKRGVDETNTALGDAVGKLYVARYFPPSSKAAAQDMVRNIIAAFSRRIDALDWMTPATREKAKAKLSTLYVGIGYPEHFTDYSGLQTKRDDAFGNTARASLDAYRRAVRKLDKPADKTEWWMTPQTVNAVNLPLQNALNFPAAILNPPFFDAAADPVQNYGAIGTVIGHEISHSFDDQGSQFDAQGRLTNWWTKDDFAHFTASADRLAKQYDAYEPLPAMHVNGKLTLSENIADVAGLSASFDGYRRATGGKPAASAQGLTGDQRFFVAFGQNWRSKFRPEALRNSLITNGHAPGEFRSYTVRNIDAWYTAFNVKPGAKLYLAPGERVRIW